MRYSYCPRYRPRSHRHRGDLADRRAWGRGRTIAPDRAALGGVTGFDDLPLRADRDELITAALTEHATTIPASSATGNDRDAAAAAVRQVYTDRTAALVCAETRLHATREPRAAQLADHIHHTLTAAITTARDRAEHAGELVALLNTAAVDTARAHADAASYADAMGERVDTALAN